MNLDQSEIRSRLQQELIQLGIKDVIALKDGKQNYVFTGLMHKKKIILKVSDARHRSLNELKTQTDMLKELSLYSSSACAPIDRLGGLSMSKVELKGLSFYVLLYPFAQGVTADIYNPHHAQLMGKSLALLHEAMKKLSPFSFKQMSELSKTNVIAQVALEFKGANSVLDTAIKHFETSERQLLHGDFSDANLKIDRETVSIFDFDNCVYGSAAYELANSLYMVLFEQVTQGKLSTYETVKKVFLEAYIAQAKEFKAIQAIDALIAYRVLLLASWLAKPNDAPLFIRQSSQQWLATLNKFVKTYFDQVHT